MPEIPPFEASDLAAWGIGYISQRVMEKAGIETLIVSYSDEQTKQVFEYTISAIITIGYSRHGITLRFHAVELQGAYQHETLDEYADRFICNYQNYQERLLGE